MPVPLLLLLSLLFVGCSSINVHHEQGAYLPRIKYVYVEKRLNDNHRFAELIATKLQSMGYQAASGPLTMMPENAQAVLSYKDEWTFDFTTHLIAFEITLRDAHTSQLLALGRYYRPWITRKSSGEMIHGALTAVFAVK